MFIVISGRQKKTFNSYPLAIRYAKETGGRVYNKVTKCKLFDAKES